MISLIIGHKGSGKTKILVDAVNSATERSAGNVVCVEKANNLTYDVNYRADLFRPTNLRLRALTLSTAF